MNTEQLGRLLTALEAIATNTQRIADALEGRTYTDALSAVRAQSARHTAEVAAKYGRLNAGSLSTDLNPEGTHA